MLYSGIQVKKYFSIAFVIYSMCIIFQPCTVFAVEKKIDESSVTLLLTSNLEGKFSSDANDQEKNDPLVLLGQSIIKENAKGKKLYFDLGNAFYPGVLSKYSYGSVIMDFFKYFDCRATLVSSEDLRIGINTMEFLQSGYGTALLSANILRDNKNLFKPYIVDTIHNKKIAFIGLSSKKILFDIAEKNVYNIKFEQEKIILENILHELKDKNISKIILLSGLDFKDNIELLNTFDKIDLIICGGDNSGDLMNGKVLRMDMADKRSIVSLPKAMGYYLLNLSFDKKISIVDIKFKNMKYYAVDNEKYTEFLSRLTRWKKHFHKKLDKIIIKIKDKPFNLDQNKVSNFLRDKYRAEIAIVKNDAIIPLNVKDNVGLEDILSAIVDDYTIFTYKISGNDLLRLKSYLKDFFVSGYDFEKDKIQGYTINPNRMYRIVSTQSVFENIEKANNMQIPYVNTWENTSDIVIDDLKNNKILLKDDYSYIDRRFRNMIDFNLSLFYEKSAVFKTKKIDVPPGKPDESYQKWGVESKIDLTIYNRSHQFIITPYIFYIKQGKGYLENLLRGTFFYTLNLDYFVKPYNKFQIDTVVSSVRSQRPSTLDTDEDIIAYYKSTKSLRPTVIRETIGANIENIYINGKIGFGFEKKVLNPVDPFVYGFESILKIKYEFFKYFIYNLNFDTFISIPNSRVKTSEKWYVRSEIENALSFKVTELISLSVKHKWFNYYTVKDKKNYSISEIISSLDSLDWSYYAIKKKQKYTNSQIITSLDLKTDFKIY